MDVDVACPPTSGLQLSLRLLHQRPQQILEHLVRRTFSLTAIIRPRIELAECVTGGFLRHCQRQDGRRAVIPGAGFLVRVGMSLQQTGKLVDGEAPLRLVGAAGFQQVRRRARSRCNARRSRRTAKPSGPCRSGRSPCSGAHCPSCAPGLPSQVGSCSCSKDTPSEACRVLVAPFERKGCPAFRITLRPMRSRNDWIVVYLVRFSRPASMRWVPSL